MKYRNHRTSGRRSQVDRLFAEALSGENERFGSSKRDHKTQQLCRQVERILTMSLGGECGDDLLRELQVVAVTPAPNAGHLLVHVLIPPSLRIEEMLERLERAKPKLRTLVAHAITRKRAPELSFIPATPGEVGHE